MRERALPKYGRVLGTSHGYVHDSWQYLHASVRVLRRAEREAARSAGRRRARARGRSGGTDGPALCGGDIGEPRRPAGRRRRNLRAHDYENSRTRARLQSRSADSGFSRRLAGARNRARRAARCAESQYGDGPAPLSPRAQGSGVRAVARTAAAGARIRRRSCRRKPE